MGGGGPHVGGGGAIVNDKSRTHALDRQGQLFGCERSLQQLLEVFSRCNDVDVGKSFASGVREVVAIAEQRKPRE